MSKRGLRARDDRGASAVEYSLLIAFVAAVIFGIVMVLGQHTMSAYSTVVGKF